MEKKKKKKKHTYIYTYTHLCWFKICKRGQIDHLKEGKVLGLASKKGGGVHGYKRRWWVLHKGFLYYFKDDFRTNKKSPNEGKPQGFVGLHGADVAWDKDRKRSGKNNAILLATHDRTFYIVPNNNVNFVVLSCVLLSNAKTFSSFRLFGLWIT
ncbi:serine/threonine protein kinase [Reticulomyxa filosa]|uniref:Serine/threonine protein kinase n=1 Tax=Reticulomyxa filosa TaxID=46433 RepID=X6NCA1_RETFI|nr:serine/threonine protein kinase [Reticulomyxa filosa]|eukprot:ETO23374.1 serine/threonine protein kinase [Reticulomyxa filosa]